MARACQTPSLHQPHVDGGYLLTGSSKAIKARLFWRILHRFQPLRRVIYHRTVFKMATEPIKKRPAVYVQISSLRPDTSGHNLKLKASLEPYLPSTTKSSKL